MGIFSWFARKSVSINSRKALQRQYFEMRGEIGDEDTLASCLDSPSVSGYVFGFVAQIIRMQKIGSRNANKAMIAALKEVFGERDAARLYESIDYYGHSNLKREFNLHADMGEQDAEAFVLRGIETDMMKSLIRDCLDGKE